MGTVGFKWLQKLRKAEPENEHPLFWMIRSFGFAEYKQSPEVSFSESAFPALFSDRLSSTKIWKMVASSWKVDKVKVSIQREMGFDYRYNLSQNTLDISLPQSNCSSFDIACFFSFICADMYRLHKGMVLQDEADFPTALWHICLYKGWGAVMTIQTEQVSARFSIPSIEKSLLMKDYAVHCQAKGLSQEQVRTAFPEVLSTKVLIQIEKSPIPKRKLNELETAARIQDRIEDSWRLYREGKRTEAIGLLINQRPKHIYTAFENYLAYYLVIDKQYAESEASLQLLFEHELADSDTYATMGLCLCFQKRFKDAKHYLDQGLELAPDNSDLLRNLGIWYAIKGQLKESQTFFDQALSIDPDLDKGYYFYGIALLAHNQRPEGIEMLEKEAKRGDVDAIDKLQRIQSS